MPEHKTCRYCGKEFDPDSLRGLEETYKTACRQCTLRVLAWARGEYLDHGGTPAGPEDELGRAEEWDCPDLPTDGQVDYELGV